MKAQNQKIEKENIFSSFGYFGGAHGAETEWMSSHTQGAQICAQPSAIMTPLPAAVFYSYLIKWPITMCL